MINVCHSDGYSHSYLTASTLDSGELFVNIFTNTRIRIYSSLFSFSFFPFFFLFLLASTLDPDNKPVKMEIATAKKTISEAKKKAKATYGRWDFSCIYYMMAVVLLYTLST